jgi:hypothetical protein
MHPGRYLTTMRARLINAERRALSSARRLALLGTLNLVLASCASAPESRLNLDSADFRAMSAEQVLFTLHNARDIQVNAQGVPGHGDRSSWVDKYAAACNGGDVDTMNVARERACRQYLAPNFQNDPRVLAFDMESLFRGCGIWAPSGQSDESVDGSTCGLLGRVFFEIGNAAAAKAVWEQAPGCMAFVGPGTVGNGCIRFILQRNLSRPDTLQLQFHDDPTGAYTDDPPRLLKIARQACGTQWDQPGVGSWMMVPDRAACEFVQRNGGAVNMVAVDEGEANVRQMQKDQAAQDREFRAEQSQQTDARLNAVVGALQSAPGGNDPNAIVNAGNQQAAAMRAIGDAAAARQQQMRQPVQPTAFQPSATPSRTLPSIPAGPSPNPTSSGGESGSAAVTYFTPLPSTCVRQYYDPAAYNWLTFENNCGQTVYLEFIFKHTVGWAMTGAWTLPPGAHVNTGRSGADINQANGFDLYVCPTDSVPVDLNGNVLSVNVDQYRCKPQ